MILQDTWTKEVAREKVLSRYILSHGMQISMTTFSYARTMELKKIELVTFFTHFGYLICL